jgi:hypothetical protein
VEGGWSKRFLLRVDETVGKLQYTAILEFLIGAVPILINILCEFDRKRADQIRL